MVGEDEQSPGDRLALALRHYDAALALVRHVEEDNRRRVNRALDQLSEAERLVALAWKHVAAAALSPTPEGQDQPVRMLPGQECDAWLSVRATTIRPDGVICVRCADEIHPATDAERKRAG